MIFLADKISDKLPPIDFRQTSTNIKDIINNTNSNNIDADTSNNSGKVGLSDGMEEMMNLGGGDEVGMNMEEGGIPGMEELRIAERVKK